MGGMEYVRNLIAAVHAADPQVRTSLLCCGSDESLWKDAAPVHSIPHWAVHSGFGRRLRLGNRFFTRAARRAEVDFIYPLTYDNEYNVGVKLPIRRDLGSIRYGGWIPDFQHRYLPELFTREELSKRDSQIEMLADDAPQVVLSSEHAASDFREFYPHHAAKARVLTFATFPRTGWSEPYTDAELEQLPTRYFVVCNQFWQHKNHLVVLQALELLRSRGIAPNVLFTGELKDYRNPAYARQVLDHIEPLQRTGTVRVLGLIPRRRQIESLRRALAVIQPSLFEGWSTVVEDARVLGRPCLLSDIPVHREQDPPGSRYFPADSPEVLAEQIAEAWDSYSPGPDLEREASAAAAASVRIREVGRRFLHIAGT